MTMRIKRTVGQTLSPRYDLFRKVSHVPDLVLKSSRGRNLSLQKDHVRPRAANIRRMLGTIHATTLTRASPSVPGAILTQKRIFISPF